MNDNLGVIVQAQMAKAPERGETVLVFDESGNEETYEAYRKRVLASGGRLRRADSPNALLRHLSVYSPAFIIHFKPIQER